MQQDIFVSYAHVDNQFGWLNHFLATQKSLFMSINRDAEPTVYFDQHSMRGNRSLDDSIKQAVQSAGIMMIIMSENWCHSEYCLQELNWFIEGTGGIQSARRRLFIVQLSSYPVRLWPAELRQNVGKVFYEENLVGDSEPISLSFKDSGKPPSVCTEFAREVWSGLEEIGRVPPPKARAVPLPARVNPQAPVVFVSEVHRQLANVRSKLAEDLRREGYQVVPDQREFRNDREAAQRDIPALLTQALIVVQLHSDRPIGLEEFDESFDRWLYDQVQSSGKTREDNWLRWRRQDLTMDAVSDLKHRELLFDSDVVAEDEAQLTTLVLARLHHIQERAKAQVVVGTGHKILLRTKESTRSLADDLSDEIDSFTDDASLVQLEAAIVQENVDLAIVEEQLRKKSIETVGLFVVYGDSDEEWAEERMKECRRLALKRRAKPPLTAVYVKPPDDQPRPQATPGRFEIVKHDEPEKLQRVLQQVLEARQ